MGYWGVHGNSHGTLGFVYIYGNFMGFQRDVYFDNGRIKHGRWEIPESQTMEVAGKIIELQWIFQPFLTTGKDGFFPLFHQNCCFTHTTTI